MPVNNREHRGRGNVTTGFTEKSAIESGFAQIYDERIAPKLERLTADRAGLRHRTRRDLLIIAGIGAVVAIAIPLILGSAWAWISFLVMTGAIILALLYVQRRSKDWNAMLIEAFMPDVCQFLGDLRYDREGAHDSFVTAFQDAGILRPSAKRTLTHHFAGSYRNTGFELVEAHLKRKKRNKDSSDSTIFNGLLFKIQVPAAIPGRIVIVPNYGAFMQKLADALGPTSVRSLDVVPMDKPDFDERFTVRGEVPDGTRALLTPGFMDALLEIDEHEGGASQKRSLAAAFVDNTFLLTLTRHEQIFSLGPIKFERPRPFLATRSILRDNPDLQGTVHTMFDDIGVAYRVIDRLHGS
ncbi:DUF3137 domain-containing protein [Fodinicurvata sp. EGI_FJ10296]|uniref:DUF3137 domain-containing protein n=1 Tax=Fodinicurvata sp. EGI_FJ10296 TaxID=3231908 RepID=UPI003451F95F